MIENEKEIKVINNIINNFRTYFDYDIVEVEYTTAAISYLELLLEYDLTNYDQLDDWTHEIVDGLVPVYYGDQLDEIQSYQLFRFTSDIEDEFTGENLGDYMAYVLYNFYLGLSYIINPIVTRELDAIKEEGN